MFYKLKKDYVLRGWKLLPTGVINRETREYKFLPKKIFSVLKLCDGQIDSESELFDDDQRKIMEELRAEGYVEANETPSLIEDGQAYKFYDNRFMRSAHWSITGKCNCKCRHCYMSAPQHKVEEFIHEQCIEIISQMEQCGIQKVILTGGEPLFRKDFWEIVDALTNADIKIEKIYSNGLLINEKFLAELEKRNLRPEFQISFDGVGCHDWLRGVEGAEKLTLRALKLLQEKNLPVTCPMALYKGNVFSLRDTAKKLSGLGVKYLKVTPIATSGEALGMSDQILSTSELYNVLIDYIPQYIAEGAPLPISLSGIFYGINASEYKIPIVKAPEGIDCDKNCVCEYIRNQIHIDFNGFVMPCPPMGYDYSGKKLFSTIFDKPLKELLNDGAYMNFINTRLKDYFKANPTCAVCEYKNRCSGGCRGLAMANNGDGDLLGVDNTACKFFKGGYYDKVITLAEKLNLKNIDA
ncbi:MAG: radical SAM protein [Selenomonadaceae bacterium]|nr:radical SAM protein [Selenomonadaceae bacterium]